jgi:hypothetical protein
VTGDLRVQVGARSLVVRRPHRVVFGRRHQAQDVRPIGESFLAITSHETMSRRWFGVEDVELTAALDGTRQGVFLMVRAESEANPVRIWDGGDPVRLSAGRRYLAQSTVIFVGDLIEGRIWGARIEATDIRPAESVLPRTGPPAAGFTVQPPDLDLSPFASDVLLARYHRYYRHPPHFDPQPVPWADVAVVLGLIDIRETADRTALRRALKDPQEAVGKVKQQIEVLFPGWLPPSSETQKTFHDHLRTVLEMRGFFEPSRLRGFDERFPAALRTIPLLDSGS